METVRSEQPITAVKHKPWRGFNRHLRSQQHSYAVKNKGLSCFGARKKQSSQADISETRASAVQRQPPEERTAGLVLYQNPTGTACDQGLGVFDLPSHNATSGTTRFRLNLLLWLCLLTETIRGEYNSISARPSLFLVLFFSRAR